MISVAAVAFSAKQLCSSVLMAGMDPEQVLKEDLAAGQGMIHTRIKPNAGHVEASALFGQIRAEAIQNGERGCTWQIDGHPNPRLPKPNQPDSTTSQPIGAAWPLIATAAANQGRICPMTAFQLRAIRDNLFWWLDPSAR